MVREMWLPVPGFGGRYEVSDQGRVRNHDGHILGQWPDAQGYLRVWLKHHGQVSVQRVHRLVASAFLGLPPDGMETRHGPGGVADNRLLNLCYGTPAENAADRLRDGTALVGSACSWAKLTEDIVRECRLRHTEGFSLRALAREHRVAYPVMRKAILGLTWSHVG